MVAHRYHLVLVALALVALGLAVVFRAELERTVLLAGSGWVAWRLVFAHARGGHARRRRRRGLLGLIEAASLAWIAWRMPPRARRGRIEPGECAPIGSLRPVYFGPDAGSSSRGSGRGPGDEIPF